MRYKNIIFDLDGTITEPAQGITNGFIYALKHFGIEVSDRTSLYKFIGPPLQVSFAQIKELSPDQVDEAIAKYREYYGTKGIYENDLIPGIKRVLEKLKADGFKLYIATSKLESFAIKILEHLEVIQYFDMVAGSISTDERNTKELVIKHVLDETQIVLSKDELDKTIMVGDRKFDVEGSKPLGIGCIGVLFGYGNVEEFEKAGAKYIVETPDDLYDLLVSGE